MLSREATPYDDACLACWKLGSHSASRLGSWSLAYCPAPAPTCHVASTTAAPAYRPGLEARLTADSGTRESTAIPTRTRFTCVPFGVEQPGPAGTGQGLSSDS